MIRGGVTGAGHLEDFTVGAFLLPQLLDVCFLVLGLHDIDLDIYPNLNYQNIY